jgi:capsular polysaccharide biosynthesis protein
MGYLKEPNGFADIVEYRPPVNMRPEWAHLFRPDNAYKKVKLGARLLRNVFVNHYGLVINNGLLVPGCAPNIGFSGYDDGFYLPHWKKAMEQMLVSRYGKSVESKSLDDDRTYLVIHSPWFSYYFWLTECLPRLLMVREYHKDLVLIYPEQWDRFAFVRDTLSLFPELRTERVKRDVHLRVKRLVMPEVKPWTPMFIPEQVHQVRDFLFGAVNDMTDLTSEMTRMVYLSRRKAVRRRFKDEDAVEELLGSFGFNAVFTEELGLFGQVQLMRKAQAYAGITGAGHINAMFMGEGSVVLDFTNVEYLSRSKYKFHYFKLCNILGLPYTVVFCDHEHKNDVKHYSNQNLILDANEVKREMTKLLAHAR